MRREIVLCGFGNVGREFSKLLWEKGNEFKERHGIDWVITTIVGREGAIYEEKGIDIKLLLSCGKGTVAIYQYADLKKIKLKNNVDFKGDVLIDVTPTDLKTGEPSLTYSLRAMEAGMNVVFASKGALVNNYHVIHNKAINKNVKFNFSGATGAALPTLDLGTVSLKGTTIKSIKAILNGTTNFILTEMYEKNVEFEEALKEAQQRGIAERNPTLDIEGYDSACKLLLITNKVMGTTFTLKDVNITGIGNIRLEDIEQCKKKSKKLKLIAESSFSDNKISLKVKPMEVDKNEFFSFINGTNKGIEVDTVEMGKIFCGGGASDPKAAAASVLKDLLNFYC
jgi:homoserine dehydrogenase